MYSRKALESIWAKWWKLSPHWRHLINSLWLKKSLAKERKKQLKYNSIQFIYFQNLFFLFPFHYLNKKNQQQHKYCEEFSVTAAPLRNCFLCCYFNAMFLSLATRKISTHGKRTRIEYRIYYAVHAKMIASMSHPLSLHVNTSYQLWYSHQSKIPHVNQSKLNCWIIKQYLTSFRLCLHEKKN